MNAKRTYFKLLPLVAILAYKNGVHDGKGFLNRHGCYIVAHCKITLLHVKILIDLPNFEKLQKASLSSSEQRKKPSGLPLALV